MQIKYIPKKTNILVAMAEKGYTQSKLSEVTMLDKSTISIFLNGKRNTSTSTVKKIALALDRDVEEIAKIIIVDRSDYVDSSVTCSS